VDTNRWKGKWTQLKGKVKEEWNEMTDDEIEAAEGRAEVLVGKIQERYGLSKEMAERRIDELYSEI
jgi:uncharacterized protein YjbJ (UPF0337 family)